MMQGLIGFGDSSGISWTVCKQSAPRSRQITMPAPHHPPCSQRRAKITKKIAAQFFPKNTTKMTRRQRCEIVWEQIRVFFSSGMKRKNDICQTQKYLLARHGISFQLSHTLMICTFALPFRWLEQAVCCVIARLLVVQRSNFSYLTINI